MDDRCFMRRRAGLWKALTAVLCVVFLMLAFAGCSDDGESSSGGQGKIDGLGEKTTGTWVVEMYVCGTDLESENGAASDDLAELTKKSSDNNINNLVGSIHSSMTMSILLTLAVILISMAFGVALVLSTPYSANKATR